MSEIMVPDLMPALPELLLALAGLVMLMVGVFRSGDGVRLISTLGVVALVVALVLVLTGPGEATQTFSGLFVVDGFAAFMKILVLIASILSIIMSVSYLRNEGVVRFEYPVLIVLSTLGMMMMISANDLLSLYLGLEMQSLPLYVLAAFKRDSARSTEAGLKYFVLGALSSGMLLYGCSMVYGFTGTTNFDGLATVFQAGGPVSLGVIVGLVFILAGLAFKVSGVPFHMWTPDVYEGAPTSVTAFFSLAPKIAAIALLMRVLTQPFGELVDQWQQVIWFISLASMVLGSVAAVLQTNIKRLMAYSSIGHVGYALIGLAAGTQAGIRGILIYMAIYLFMNAGAFVIILAMRRQGKMVEQISDLAGMSRNHPVMALALAAFMFSMAGIPPLAGFFGKLYVFLAAVEAQMYVLAVLGVLTSVIGAYYYLRIVKVMYFDEPAEAFDRPLGGEMKLVLAVTAAVTALFFLVPGPVLSSASAAAAALMP